MIARLSTRGRALHHKDWQLSDVSPKAMSNASDFLRRHPGHRGLAAKPAHARYGRRKQAHKVSRKKERARLRNCGVALKRLLLCRPSWDDLYAEDEPDLCHPTLSSNPQSRAQPLRRTNPMLLLDTQTHGAVPPSTRKAGCPRLPHAQHDRGLDNFMIRHDVENDEIKIGAIDNSLSFPSSIQRDPPVSFRLALPS